MKEEDIRPDLLMRENARLFQEDLREILEHRNAFIDVNCPACEAADFNVEFTKNGFTFVRCQQCETLFVSPRPDSETLNAYYAHSRSLKHWNDKIFPVSEDTRRRQIFAPRAEKIVELCKKHGADKKVILDVGAGFGTFCEEIIKFGLFDKVIAVEPAHGLAETCRVKGLNVIEEPIEKVSMDNISVITNFELLEHLFRPKDFLTACWQVLPRGGLLILTTPNIKGFDLLMLRNLSDNINAPNHLNYFHPQSLELLLNRCGFQTVEIMTPGKLDAQIVRKKVLDNTLKIAQPDAAFLQHILIDRWDKVGEAFQRFISDNGLSSHLWVVAKKQ